MLKGKECKDFSANLDSIKAILQRDIAEPEIIRLVSLYITLPQSLERIKRALREQARAKKDLFDVLDLISDRLGEAGNKLKEDDFNKVLEHSTEIHVQASRLAGELEKRGG